MKKIFLLLASVSLFSLNSFAKHEVSPKLGFASTALGIGVDYNYISNNVGPGGFLYFQTEKKKDGTIVENQTISIGGTIKFNIVDSNNTLVYFAPGFGIHMLKEAGAPDANGKSSDETIFGPIYNIGAQYKFTSLFALGLERRGMYNWFSDKFYARESETYALAGTFSF